MDSYNNKHHFNHIHINLSWFDRLSIKHKFLFLVTGALLGLTFLTLISIYSIKQISINGPVYERLKINQDLIADIMPPPMYLVDAAFQLQLFIQHAENSIARINGLMKAILNYSNLRIVDGRLLLLILQ